MAVFVYSIHHDKIMTLPRYSTFSKIYLRDIYNIGVLTVNVELMWRGLVTGERRTTEILYLPALHQCCIYPAIKFAKQMLFNLSM